MIDEQLVKLSPVYRNRTRSIDECFASDLLSLTVSSDAPDPDRAQFERAQKALAERSRLIDSGWRGEASDSARSYFELCYEIVDHHLKTWAAYYGEDQCAPFDEVDEISREERDIYLIVKFLDEEPHIRSTVDSLLTQKGVDPSRIVLVGADNMSTDRSGEIFREMQDSQRSQIRMVYCQQPTPGGGSAARYGVDRCLATILETCRRKNDFSLLHRARIAVSDGDTVYHPYLLADATEILDTYPDIDGIMPFLTYKVTAALRLFEGYVQADVDEMSATVRGRESEFVRVAASLAAQDAQDTFSPMRRRLSDSDDAQSVVLGTKSGEETSVPLFARTNDGKRFGVIVDPEGNRAFVMQDRFLIPERAPVSGFENALVYLDNGSVPSTDIWRWHSVVGHDLFLLWAFSGMGLAREFVLPDTSDALKQFRAWAFSVGGQHQLSRPNTKRVTGTDYQSGRVLQCFGARSVLGVSTAHTETEIDRLVKMVRNFSNDQSVFYGNTRSEGLERASGLYLHMTKIQDVVEAEVRSYKEEFFRDIVFPERVIFPFRWMLQNFICAYACADLAQRSAVVEKSFNVIFSSTLASEIIRKSLTEDVLIELRECSFEELRRRAELIAEEIISSNWAALLVFYEKTLRSFMKHYELRPQTYEFLLEPVKTTRNGLLDDKPMIDVGDVWSAEDFVIDEERGQVVRVAAHE